MKNFKMVVIVSSIMLISGSVFLIGKKKKAKSINYKIKEDKRVDIKGYKIKIPSDFKELYKDNKTIQFVNKEEILITATVIDYEITKEKLINVLYTLIDTEKGHYKRYEEKEFKAIAYTLIPNCFFIGSSGHGYENGIGHDIYMWNYVNINSNNILYLNITKKEKTFNTYDKEISEMVISVTYDGGKE